MLKRSLKYKQSYNKLYEIPNEYICPITHIILKNPVDAEDGFLIFFLSNAYIFLRFFSFNIIFYANQVVLQLLFFIE